ncbi:MAG: hydrogenase maturation nickel metallochaperone HypA [Hyphomicrobiales bacterium]|nr:hydrogenase maturation nickel metallochaperone HypA [Hyphomicrobiales bacterium]
MHETAVVMGLLDILERKATEHGVGRIVSVKVVLGRLRGLDPRQIVGAFEIFSEGTRAEGARLIVEEVVPTARCRGCGTVFAVEGWSIACPSCGGEDAETVSGRELHIAEFEAAAADGPHENANGSSGEGG